MGHLSQLKDFISSFDLHRIHCVELKQQKLSALHQLDSLLSYFETTWFYSGQFFLNVFKQDGNGTNNPLTGWHRKFNSLIGQPHSNTYLVHVIKRERALADLVAVQLEAGSQPPRQRRKYVAVDQHLKVLKEAYVGKY